MVSRVIEGTIVLILAYLVIANAPNFSTAIRSMGQVYIGSIKALQGRG